MDIYQLPPNVALDPIFDGIGIGPMPLWLMIIVVLFLGIGLSNAWWVVQWFIMRPVSGAATAANTTNVKTQQAFMFGKNRSFSIQALEYIDGILSHKDPNSVSKWMLTAPTSVGRVGQKPVLIVSDNYDCVRDPIAEMAVCRIAKEVTTKDGELVINSYTDFINFIPYLESNFPEGIPIPIYALYSPDEVQKYTPKDRSAGMFGAMVTRDATKINMANKEFGLLEKYLPLILIVGVAAIAIIIVYMVVTGQVKT